MQAGVGPVVWLAANTLSWPEGGGYLWTALNWALGLRESRCEVIWLESAEPEAGTQRIRSLVRSLKRRLEPYGLAESVALCSRNAAPLPEEAAEDCIELEAAREADLLLNISYETGAAARPLFRRTALLDIDPGLTQIWISEGVMPLPPYDLYFTIGETVGVPRSNVPDVGVTWQYTPPCVAVEYWPVRPAPLEAPFTTVSGWRTRSDWVTFQAESYLNSKREGFLPFLDLPRHTRQPLELALCLALDEKLRLAPDEADERRQLEERGWRVVHSYSVASTPWDFQRYVGESRGELSCAKPSCVRLQNAWVSDRTICYLASGRPAVVQHTGPSRFLPDAAGLFRFRDLEEAVRCLELAASDYETQGRLARELAEEHFNARTVTTRLLEHALP
jgi:hypothetical protein